MCTSIAITRDNFYFGRNMDLDYEFGERVVVTPRRYPITFRKAGPLDSHYALIGMATVEAGYPLYAEASNEKGLCIAGLNFPGNAWYSPQLDPIKSNVSPFELPLWILGQCASLEEARCLLGNTHLTAIPFSRQLPLAPLHWHIADRTGSIVLECTREGTQIYDNPVGVMTNNPPFSFHLANICQYMNLLPGTPDNCFSTVAGLQPFGYGLGSVGLPGDFSPASRFVKAAYLAMNSACEKDEKSCVSQFFHLLGSVSMVRGSVIVPNGGLEMTTYTCCINADKGHYYYSSYSNSQITGVDLFREDLSGAGLVQYPLRKTPQIAWEN